MKHSYSPPNGFVPDSTTAMRVAEAVLTLVYDAKQVMSEKPFTAILRGEVWHVQGHLREGAAGGVAIVDIAKIDGRILRMSHGK